MRAVGLVWTLAFLVVTASSGTSVPTGQSDPVAAVALIQPGGALLAWTPAVEAPDFYLVFGVRDGSFFQVGMAPADSISSIIDTVYPSYAVAAVVDGAASAPAVAMNVYQSCLSITYEPPDVAIGDCTDVTKVGVSIRLP